MAELDQDQCMTWNGLVSVTHLNTVIVLEYELGTGSDQIRSGQNSCQKITLETRTVMKETVSCQHVSF